MSRPARQAEQTDVDGFVPFDRAAEDLLGAFVRAAGDLAAAPIAGVSLVGEQEQVFRVVQGMSACPTPRSEAFCSHAILDPDTVMVVPDLMADSRFRACPLVAGEPKLRFYAGAPLRNEGGGAIGTLCVMDRLPRCLPGPTIERLRDLARGVSAALSLRHAVDAAHRAARTDPLTGACNRKGLDEALAEAGPDGTGLLMIDLDGFKPINDTHGHAVGDQALVEVARRLRETVRAGDVVARLGGDEFVVLARSLDAPETGLGLARRIHGALADTFVLNGATLPLRASIGFAAMPWHATDITMLMERADAALYTAKRAGRGVTRAALPLIGPGMSGFRRSGLGLAGLGRTGLGPGCGAAA